MNIHTPEWLRGKLVQLHLRKKNERQVVNAETFWEISISMTTLEEDLCYVLQIKHHYPEEEIRFFVWDSAISDPQEIVSESQLADERALLERYEDLDQESIDRKMDQFIRERPTLLEIRQYLLDHWRAVCLIVSPSINL